MTPIPLRVQWINNEAITFTLIRYFNVNVILSWIEYNILCFIYFCDVLTQIYGLYINFVLYKTNGRNLL